MKKKYVSIIILLSLLSIITVYFLYPKQGSFEKLVLSKYEKNSFTKIMIQNSSHKQEKSIKDKNKILEFLSYMSKLNLKEYKKNIPDQNDEIYYFNIYGNNNEGLSIIIYNSNYIEVYENKNKPNRFKRYKVINKNINMKDIEKIFD